MTVIATAPRPPLAARLMSLEMNKITSPNPAVFNGLGRLEQEYKRPLFCDVGSWKNCRVS